jgi:hypothetical protein
VSAVSQDTPATEKWWQGLVVLDDGASTAGVKPCDMGAPPEDSMHARLELCLRDIESAYVLAARWIQLCALAHLGLETRFYQHGFKSDYVRDPCTIDNLLMHLVHMRVNLLLELEQRLMAQDHSVRGKLSMVRRRLGNKSALDAYMQQLASSDEQLVRQVQHWRTRHDRLCYWAMQSADDLDMVPLDYARSALVSAHSVTGMPEPPLVRAFREHEPFPLHAGNMRQVQVQRTLHWRQTPQEYLLKHCPTPRPHVLVDFQDTVREMSTLEYQWCAHWFPHHETPACSDLQRIVEFCSARSRNAKEDAMKLQEQARQARRRKAPTYADKVLEEQRQQEQLRRANALHKELEESLRKGFHAESHNRMLRACFLLPGYDVLRAVVYRVNASVERMLLLQQQIELLETELKHVLRPAPPPQAEHEPADSTHDYDPKQDDDGRFSYDQKLQRAMERLQREAQQRQSSGLAEQALREQLDLALSNLHQWKRFQYSHLHMATLLMDLEDPSDAVLHRSEPVQDEPSLYHQAYPYSELGLGEELLRSIQPFVMTVELVYGSETGGWSQQDPRYDWHAMLKKIFPKACSDRDFAVKNDEICRKNAVYCDFVLESLQASLLGL